MLILTQPGTPCVPGKQKPSVPALKEFGDEPSAGTRYQPECLWWMGWESRSHHWPVTSVTFCWNNIWLASFYTDSVPADCSTCTVTASPSNQSWTMALNQIGWGRTLKRCKKKNKVQKVQQLLKSCEKISGLCLLPARLMSLMFAKLAFPGGSTQTLGAEREKMTPDRGML